MLPKNHVIRVFSYTGRRYKFLYNALYNIKYVYCKIVLTKRTNIVKLRRLFKCIFFIATVSVEIAGSLICLPVFSGVFNFTTVFY